MARPNYAIAASVAALIVAAPLAFHTYRETTNFKSSEPVSSPLAKANAERQLADNKATAEKIRDDQRTRVAQDEAPRRVTVVPVDPPTPAAKMAAAPAASPAPSVPVPATQPTSTAATQPTRPSAWVKLCEPTGSTTLCLIQHERLDGNTGQVLVAAALHDDVATGRRTFLIRVPLVLPTGATMTVSIDAASPDLIMTQVNCDASGCTFSVPADATLMQRLQSATTLMTNVLHNQNRNSFPIPMTGFSVALAGPPNDNVGYTQARAPIMRQLVEQQTALFDDFKKQATATAAADAKAKAEARRKSDADSGQQLAAGGDKAPAKPAEPKSGPVTAAAPSAAPTAIEAASAAAERAANSAATTARKGDRQNSVIAMAPPLVAVQGLDNTNSGTRRFNMSGLGAPVDAPATTQRPTPDTRERIADVTRLEQERDALHRAQAQGRVLGEQIASLDREIAAKRAELAQPPQITEGRDRFEALDPYPIKRVAEDPVSTFSMDVDTASYAFVRRALNAGRFPSKDAVRVEEMINYFPYDYPRPESASAPFLPTVTVVPSPWNTANKLVHIAVKGYAFEATQRPRANLVFLVDVSGSMGPADRLPLLRNAFRMLVEQLKPDDTVAIVTYANNTRVALEPTKALDKARIISVIDSLQAGGGTYGEGGLQKAYSLAEANFDKAGVNRIILATDGDFNIGISDRNQLKSFIEKKRETGIFLSVLGVGIGNHNDALMQTLARNGNGAAAYIDTLAEARKVLVDEVSSTLFPIAKDAKIQVEFNPTQVSEYRLIGYEKRALRREDFNNDQVDAAEIGSGLSVTAIYEITPIGAVASATDPLRYARPDTTRREPAGIGTPDAELGFLKLRYKLPKEDASKLLTLPIVSNAEQPLANASPDVRFSIAVAGFGQLLKGALHTKIFGFDQAAALASTARGDDPFGYRAEFISLTRLAKSARP